MSSAEASGNQRRRRRRGRRSRTPSQAPPANRVVETNGGSATIATETGKGQVEKVALCSFDWERLWLNLVLFCCHISFLVAAYFCTNHYQSK